MDRDEASKRQVVASNPQQWVFVTTTVQSSSSLSHHKPKPTPAQRTIVKRHVMRDIGHSRRKQGHNYLTTPVLNTIELLPYGLVTVESDAQRVVSHMFSNDLPSCLQVYRDKWYPLCIKDTAAFQQMTASYAVHLLQYEQGAKTRLNRLILAHHIKAMESIRLRLNGLHDSASDGLLTTIAALACHEHLNGNMAAWKMHISALNLVINSKKLQLATSNPALLSLLQWVDNIGSIAFDIPPSLGIYSPSKLTECDLFPATTALYLPEPLPYFFNSLRLLNSELVQLFEVEGPTIWKHPTSIDCLLDPVICLLLSSACRPDGMSPDNHVFLCHRAGAILYLAEFRRWSGVSPVRTDLYIQTLRSKLDICGSPTAMNHTLLLWLLTVGAIESTSLVDQTHFQERLFPITQVLGLDTIENYTDSLSRVVWFPSVFKSKLASLWHKIAAYSLIQVE